MATASKTDKTGNFIAGILLAFGLLASFGGIDLSSLAAIFLILSPFIAYSLKGINSKKNSVIRLFFFAFLIAIIGFYIGHSQYLKMPISEGMKHIIFVPFLMPFAAKIFREVKGKVTIARSLVAALAFLIIFLLIEALTQYQMYKIANPTQVIKDIEVNLGRAAFIALCLFWPAIYAAKHLMIDTKFIFLAFILMMGLCTQFGMDLHLALFPIACLAAFLARYFPRLITGIVFLVPALLISFAPFIYNSAAVYAKNYFGDQIPMSWGRRADMWIYAYNRIIERPLFGWGFDGARQFNETVQYAGYEWGAIQMHPHSAPMHIWLEGGIVGAILFVGMLFFGAILTFKSRLVSKRNAWAFCGLFTSIIIAWSLSYSIWEQWLWALTFILIGALASIAKSNDEKKYAPI